MNEKGGFPMFVLALLATIYLLCSESPTVKESLTVQLTENTKEVEPITKDPQPSPSDKKLAKEIVIFTSKNCPPCERWKRCEQPKFEANGWKVAYCEKHDFPLTPSFIIESDGKMKEKRGYFSYEQLGEVLR